MKPACGSMVLADSVHFWDSPSPLRRRTPPNRMSARRPASRPPLRVCNRPDCDECAGHPCEQNEGASALLVEVTAPNPGKHALVISEHRLIDSLADRQGLTR